MSSSVVVNYLHRFSASSRPTETKTELIVDPNAVLSGAVSLECLKPIARRHAQIVEPLGDLQLAQLAPSDSFNVDKALDPLTTSERRCVGIGKGDDHSRIVTCGVTNVKGNQRRIRHLTFNKKEFIIAVELYSIKYNSTAIIIQESTVTAPDRIQWLSDLIRVEIVLWERIDARLRQEHALSLAFFETLHFTAHSPDGSQRIGELARSLRITVGATSKLVDRIEAAGLIRRELDADDRRASRVALTDAGRHALAAASMTYTAELATVLDATLTTDEQQVLHSLVKRLLISADSKESG